MARAILARPLYQRDAYSSRMIRRVGPSRMHQLSETGHGRDQFCRLDRLCQVRLIASEQRAGSILG
jgi:hypothetical protein